MRRVAPLGADRTRRDARSRSGLPRIVRTKVRSAVTRRRARAHRPLPTRARPAPRRGSETPLIQLVEGYPCWVANAVMRPPSTVGLLERQRVAAVELHEAHARVHALEHAAGDRGVLLVVRAGHEHDRHRECAHLAPHRRHGARAEAPQARGEELRCEPAAVGETGGIGRNRSRTSAGPANPSRNAATPSCSTLSASISSASTRAARSAGSAIPGEVLTSMTPRTMSGRSSASRRQSRPPIE